MDILRTPESRFSGLPDYPFESHYLSLGSGLRMHYLDEGPRDAEECVLMLHGEPSWSYLYRHMIAPVAGAGLRVLAPDLIGFGKSDKPAAHKAYSYAAHLDWLREWMETLDLKRITLVGQDWGSLLGLRLATEHSERFERIIIGNGLLPTGDDKLSFGVTVWRAYSRFSPVFPVAKLVQGAVKRRLTQDELAAYDAPFPTAAHKVAARVFPALIPVHPSNPAREPNRRAWEVLARWDKPFITCFSDADPITAPWAKRFQERVPGARGQDHVTLRGGHFLQEDDPEGFVRVILKACGKG